MQFLFAGSCNKDGSRPCRNAPYAFDVTSVFTPQKETYNVNDTIFFTSTLSKSLVNTISNQQIDYSNSVGIGGDIGIVFPDPVSLQNKPAKDSFDFISLNGNFIPRPINQNQGINTVYTEHANYYIFKGEIICKKRGYMQFQLII